jgi:hypothetical protein
MGKIVERIGVYAEKRKISIRRIEQEIGASNGTLAKAISKGKDVLAEWVSVFVQKYPEVNPVWLLTGEGTMLRDSDDVSAQFPDSPKENFLLRIQHLEEMVKIQQEKNQLLEDLVQQLKANTKGS